MRSQEWRIAQAVNGALFSDGICAGAIFMTARELLRQHRAQVLELAAKHGALDVRVFGSAARGEEDEASDIDLLVRMEPGRSLFDVGALVTDLQELLGRRVDVVTERGLRPRIREDVLRDAVPL